MSRPGTHIAWFMALSAALHAAILLVGNRPDTIIGPAGRLVHVSMTYRAGVPKPLTTPAGSAERARQSRTHIATIRPTPLRAAAHTIRRHHGEAPHETASTQPATVRPAQDAPAVQSTAAAGTEATRQDAEQQLRKRILQLVSSHFEYPVLARRKGWQGIVRLQVHIESNGRISRLQVEQTSGYPVLDQAALQSLQLASVPDAAHWMQGQAIDIIIPVEYRLVGG
jgi:protein TonB